MNYNNANFKFNKWNPMENDFKNIEFNQYISGPGANIEAGLQPAQLALQQSSTDGAVKTDERPVPTLLFKNLPMAMTTRAMYNICSKYGKVLEVRDSSKNSYYFADMASVADMEAVFRALENNPYGFKVMIAKPQNKKPADVSKQQFASIPPKNTGIDYENRCYRTSQKKLPRPKVMDDVSLLDASSAPNTGVLFNLLANDAHSLERQGLYNLPNNDKFNYHHGRSHVKMPEKTMQFIEKKHKESSGNYNANDDNYVHKVDNSLMPTNFGKCCQCFYACDTVCGRCSQYYCSVECQEKDWPNHRYICGKPKHLQQTPPSKRNSQPNNNSSKLFKENSEKIPLKDVSNEEVVKPAKTIPKQLLCNTKVSSQQLQTSSKTSPLLHNSLKTSPQQLENTSEASSEKLPTCSKTASKKLPAALKIFSKQLPNKSEESSQQIKTSSKPHQDAQSSNNSKKTTENYEDTYKQNMPRSGSIVFITAISKTNVVFIRSTTYDDNLSYLNTVDTLQQLGSMLKPLKSLPKSGMVVVAKFEEQFNRALVLNIFSPTKIAIHFMDYGNMEHAKIEDLFEAPQQLIYKPRHAIPVILKDVTNCYMTQEIRKFMHSYLNNIKVEIRYKPEDFLKDDNVFAVELIDESTQQNINKMIMKLSKPIEPRNTNEICDRNYLEKKILPTGKNLEFIVMDNSLMCSGCISCTIKPYAIEIEKFKKDIQAYVESIPKEAYTPIVHELCVARYSEDGLWYRGLCLETVGDGHPSIHFIDYGNITFVPIESIRRYPPQFTFPIYTADCAIEGVPEFCDDELVARLEDLIPNGEIIKCENVTVDEENNFYILTLPDVIKELIKCGLIQNV